VAPRQSVPRPILSRIVVPLTLPGITAAGLFGFINACGALLVPLILVVNPSRQRAALVFPQLTTDTHVLYGDIAAYRLIYALPVLVLYLLVLVRAPRSAPRDAVQPLSPITVERIRAAMLNPAPREVVASSHGQRRRRCYELPAPGTPQTWQRDGLIVSMLAYAGLRPGELRALPFGGVRENTILVQRGANPDGSSKPTKNRQHRTVRLLPALAHDVREYDLAVGGRSEENLILLDDHGRPWDKNTWQMWRADRWVPACRAVGLDPVPRPYDLRHSFASLLLAEGRQPIWIAKQLGHSLAVFLSTYAHLIDEFEDRERIDADAEIADARRQVGTHLVRTATV
jgi:integrase